MFKDGIEEKKCIRIFKTFIVNKNIANKQNLLLLRRKRLYLTSSENSEMGTNGIMLWWYFPECPKMVVFNSLQCLKFFISKLLSQTSQLRNLRHINALHQHFYIYWRYDHKWTPTEFLFLNLTYQLLTNTSKK